MLAVYVKTLVERYILWQISTILQHEWYSLYGSWFLDNSLTRKIMFTLLCLSKSSRSNVLRRRNSKTKVRFWLKRLRLRSNDTIFCQRLWTFNKPPKSFVLLWRKRLSSSAYNQCTTACKFLSYCWLYFTGIKLHSQLLTVPEIHNYKQGDFLHLPVNYPFVVVLSSIPLCS